MTAGLFHVPEHPNNPQHGKRCSYKYLHGFRAPFLPTFPSPVAMAYSAPAEDSAKPSGAAVTDRLYKLGLLQTDKFNIAISPPR